MNRRIALLRQLEAYSPPEPEIRSHNEIVAFLRDPADPFSVDRYEPGHVTAGGLVLSSDLGLVLLIHHRRLDMWIEPGGHVDPTDADVVATATREVGEETGVTDIVPVGGGVLTVDAHEIPAYRSQPAHTHYNISYGFVAKSVDLSPSDEVAAARWQALDQVDELTEDAAVRRAVLKLVRLVEGGSTSRTR